MQSIWKKSIAVVATVLLSVPTLSMNVAATQTLSTPSQTLINVYKKQDKAIDFNDDWKFKRVDSDASNRHFDDASWETVRLPHDYSLTQDYQRNGEAESGYKPGGIGWYRKTFTLDKNDQNNRVIIRFDGAYMESEVYVNGQKVGFHPYGYTSFAYDISDYVEFGKTNVIAVKTNNKIPSSRWYSGSGLYRQVQLNIVSKTHISENGVVFTTPNLSENQSQPQVVVKTTVENDSESQSNITVKHHLFKRNADGSRGAKLHSFENPQAHSIEAHASQTITSEFTVNQPELWSVDSPNLYFLTTEIYDNGNLVQTQDNEVGFRYSSFNSNTGFALNGQSLKLQGVSMHHDQGALGSSAYYDAIQRQFDILKSMGVNAVRVTHNPSSRAMKDIANRRGMLLIDEAFDTWKYAKNGNYNDYARFFNQPVGDDAKHLEGVRDLTQTWAKIDIQQMVKSGINDPSIIMWSTGNEVMEGFSANVADYPQVVSQLANWIEEIDSTRPATIGDNKLKANWREAIGIGESLSNRQGLQGVVGLNYANGGNYDYYHQNYPTWQLYGSETASSINSRNVYDVKNGTHRNDRQLTSYDQSKVGWGHYASEAWYDIITRDYVAGTFVWTGFDYLGEPTPWNGIGSGSVGAWPAPKSSYFGIVDTAGLPKDSYYFYQSQWNQKVTTLHVLPAWKNEAVVKDSNGNVEVVVYSNAPKVRLVHTDTNGNETVIGEKALTQKTTAANFKYRIYEGADRSSTPHKNLYLTWNVPYRDGSIKAIALDEQGNEITNTSGISERKTFSNPTKLAISNTPTTIKAGKDRLAYVEIDVQDENGNPVTNDSSKINVNVTGSGTLVGLDNGNPLDHQSYQDNNRKAFGGKLVAIVKSNGKNGAINVSVTSDGKQSASTTINAIDADESSEVKPQSYLLSKTIYLQQGSKLQLPEKTTVTLSNQTTVEKGITWDFNDEKQALLDKGQSITVSGTINDYNVSVDINVVVINAIGAMRNIALASEKGSQPQLPETVQAYTKDGQLIDANFPVEWNLNQFNADTTGVQVVNGTATVMGKQYPVTASIRVAEKTITIDQNVAASAMSVTQDIPQNLQTDTLSSIYDGSTTASPNSDGGDNPTIWSNYKASQAGVKTSTIKYEYATAQNIAEVTVYNYVDSYSARVPKSTTFSWKRSTNDAVQQVNATVVGQPERNGTIVKTVYRLERPVPAVEFNVTFTNSDEDLGNRFPCTAVSEIELKTALETFPISSNADLNSMTLNGTQISNQVLNSGLITTPSYESDLKVSSNENVGITVLPVHKDVIRIFTTSEDGKITRSYVVRLGDDAPLTDDDARNDVDYTTTTATAGSTQSGADNAIGNAYDNDPSTIWHSAWAGAPLSSLNITTDLGSSQEIEALRYLPRQEGENGFVKEYEVYVSDDNQTWKKVTNGTWTFNREWKIASFDKVTARYVKLQAVQTMGDGGRENTFMSAAEIRIRKARTQIVKPEITLENVTLQETNFTYTGEEIKPEPIVSVNNKTLTKDEDYVLEYENNVNVGNGLVRVRGIRRYSGTVELPFTINSTTPKVDKSLLQAKIDEYSKLDAALFEKEGFDQLTMALDNARKLLSNDNVTQDEISKETEKLVQLFKALKPKKDEPKDENKPTPPVDKDNNKPTPPKDKDDSSKDNNKPAPPKDKDEKISNTIKPNNSDKKQTDTKTTKDVDTSDVTHPATAMLFVISGLTLITLIRRRRK